MVILLNYFKIKNIYEYKINNKIIFPEKKKIILFF
jgi:hypothetical protein